MASNISRTYVAAQGPAILGYYSLAMAAIQKDQLPELFQGRFPTTPCSVIRSAHLAVDRNYQRQGLGELLLVHALCRCSRLAQEIGMAGVIVDAEDEDEDEDDQAKAYYQRFEFESLPDLPLTLWLPRAAIIKLCGHP